MKKTWSIIILVLILALGSSFLFGNKILFPLKYKNYIQKYSAEYKIDANILAAVINKESGFRDFKYEQGEKNGLGQFKDEAALAIAKKMDLKDFKPENLADAETSIKITAWYLANNKGNSIDEMTKAWVNRNNGNPSEEYIEFYSKDLKKAKGWYKVFHPSIK